MVALRIMAGLSRFELGCGIGRRAATCRPREKEWIEMTTSTRELLLNDALVLMEETEGNE